MNAAGDLLETARTHLASYGLDFTHDRPEYVHSTSAWKGSINGTLLRIIVLSPMTLSALANEDLDGTYAPSQRLPVLLVGRTIHERSASAFRDLGIWFVDSVGNAYVRSEGVFIDVRGRGESVTPGPRNPSEDDRRSRPSNLFSSGRAQVICTLLTWPHLAQASVRMIASSAGVSAGQAHGALALLEKTGYLVDRVLRADRTDELLALWTAAYPQGLGRKLEIASYDSRADIQTLLDDLHDPDTDGIADALELSGESAPGLGLKQPRSVTIYVRDWTSHRAVRRRWRAAKTAANADVHVRHRFWTDPGASTAGHATRTAPWPIVYADLMKENDPRLSDAARSWRARHGAL